MKVLLDTCTFIWAAEEPAKLSTLAVQIIQDPANTIAVSVASLWEIGIKLNLRKLPIASDIPALIQAAQAQNIDVVPIPPLSTHVIATLPHHHSDPFDRILIATAMVDVIPIVTPDIAYDKYGVTRIW